MIHLISTIDSQRTNWLPQFIQHYKKIGAQTFHITSHVQPELSPDEKKMVHLRVKEILAGENIDWCGYLDCPFDAINLRMHHDWIQRTLDPEDWIIWADIDEFQEYWDELPAIIAGCEQEKINIIGGDFLDRASHNGDLTVFDPHQPIWHQYPNGCNITHKILKGQTNKVVISKAFIKLKFANHDPLKKQALSWHHQRAVVHHFKWDRSVLDRLQFRLSPYWKKKFSWWRQTKRFYDHIQQFGRINLDILQTSSPTYNMR